MTTSKGRSAAFAAVLVAVAVSMAAGCGGGGKAAPSAAGVTASGSAADSGGSSSSSSDVDDAVTPSGTASSAPDSASSSSSSAQSASPTRAATTTTAQPAVTKTTAKATTANSCADPVTLAQITKCPPHPKVARIDAITCHWNGFDTLHVGIQVYFATRMGSGWRYTFSDPRATIAGGNQIVILDDIPYPRPSGPFGNPSYTGPASYVLSGTITVHAPAGNAQVPVKVSMSCA